MKTRAQSKRDHEAHLAYTDFLRDGGMTVKAMEYALAKADALHLIQPPIIAAGIDACYDMDQEQKRPQTHA